MNKIDTDELLKNFNKVEVKQIRPIVTEAISELWDEDLYNLAHGMITTGEIDAITLNQFVRSLAYAIKFHAQTEQLMQLKRTKQNVEA